MSKSKLLLAHLAIFGLVACSESRFKELPPPPNAKGTIFFENPTVAAQQVPNWFTKDSELEGVEGTSADRAYAEFKLPKGEEVIVAVIDSGVDITHEDLQGKLWVNADEIPGNKIDDDNNGYVDDVHGWNFLGTVDKDGNNIHLNDATLEVTRELIRLKKLKTERPLTPEEEAYFQTVETKVTSELATANASLSMLLVINKELKAQYEKLKELLGVPYEAVTADMVKALDPQDPEAITAKEKMIEIFTSNNLVSTARLIRLLDYYSSAVNFYYNENFDPRRDIIGDDLSDFSDISYGNPDVKGPDSFHGTHVSGIIAATRNNGIGVDGVAENVKIMAIRAVPNGDEYDKDVANAVRYATDNGAKVINMSFGKSYSSPHKEKVDQAFAYAASKGVVIVHSAGNDAKENTPYNNYPNKYVKNFPGATIGNWIEVGASTSVKGLELPAFFSNFGRETVDVFAPGHLILSTVPDQNKYGVASGTSMAGPCVAGVAALLISQDPSLTGAEVRDLIRQRSKVYPELKVKHPASTIEIFFSQLSSTGGVVNAYQALKKVLAIR